jgi:uncharacterized protein YdeI (YjbR/CyaY-like superfamily)
MASAKEFEIVAFATAKEWRQWLAKNHAASDGTWLRLFKKTSGAVSVTYDEALDEALCYGWIDGQLKSGNEKSWLRKFTPRRAKSIWSKKNQEHVARLTKSGRMTAAGLKAVDAARQDGRWAIAYDSAGKTVIPKDFLKELSKNSKAKAFFGTLNKANVYAITWRLQTAKKPETRQKRLEAILAMLAKGEKFHA